MYRELLLVIFIGNYGTPIGESEFQLSRPALLKEDQTNRQELSMQQNSVELENPSNIQDSVVSLYQKDSSDAKKKQNKQDVKTKNSTKSKEELAYNAYAAYSRNKTKSLTSKNIRTKREVYNGEGIARHTRSTFDGGFNFMAEMSSLRRTGSGAKKRGNGMNPEEQLSDGMSSEAESASEGGQKGNRRGGKRKGGARKNGGKGPKEQMENTGEMISEGGADMVNQGEKMSGGGSNRKGGKRRGGGSGMTNKQGLTGGGGGRVRRNSYKIINSGEESKVIGTDITMRNKRDLMRHFGEDMGLNIKRDLNGFRRTGVGARGNGMSPDRFEDEINPDNQSNKNGGQRGNGRGGKRKGGGRGNGGMSPGGQMDNAGDMANNGEDEMRNKGERISNGGSNRGKGRGKGNNNRRGNGSNNNDMDMVPDGGMRDESMAVSGGMKYKSNGGNDGVTSSMSGGGKAKS